METRKLFYEDPHLTQCAATVLSCQETADGWAVILDQTVFYPEGGGQACDIGLLGGVQVLDVQEKDEKTAAKAIEYGLQALLVKE